MSIDWCKKQGMKLIEPNDNLTEEYNWKMIIDAFYNAISIAHESSSCQTPFTAQATYSQPSQQRSGNQQCAQYP